MLGGLRSYRNKYVKSVIREYTEKGKETESHGWNREGRAYLNTNDLKVN